jgi:hypothetical protein
MIVRQLGHVGGGELTKARPEPRLLALGSGHGLCRQVRVIRVAAGKESCCTCEIRQLAEPPAPDSCGTVRRTRSSKAR